MSRFVENLERLHKEQESYVQVTLVAIRGSAPQVVGAKMLVTTEGLFWGTVGGGKIEAHCLRYAQALLEKKASPEMNIWNLQKDIGMSCGGEASLFFEPVCFNRWTVAIFGAGHISQELCRILQTWSCQVRVFDTRPEWLAKLPTSPNIIKKHREDLSFEVKNLPEKTYLLSMTQGHASDLPVLYEALRTSERFSFIGVIGSKVKAKKLKVELQEKGIPPENVDRLVSPLGLPIGDNTPPEIAVSIASQLLAVRDGVSIGDKLAGFFS